MTHRQYITHICIVSLLCGMIWATCGCAVVSANRVFPKLTWYWSADAQEQRRENASEKKYHEQINKADENWTDDTNELEKSYQTITRLKAQRVGITNGFEK